MNNEAMSDRDHQWKFFEHLWKVDANKAEREFAFKSGWDCCESVLKQENTRLREVLEQLLGASSFLVCTSDSHTCYRIDKVFNEIKKELERGK